MDELVIKLQRVLFGIANDNQYIDGNSKVKNMLTDSTLAIYRVLEPAGSEGQELLYTNNEVIKKLEKINGRWRWMMYDG